MPRKSKAVDQPVGLQTIGKPIAKTQAHVATTGDNMDILDTPKGTLFQLFRETFVTTSEPYYCHIHHINKVKAHNITTGQDEEIGQIALLGAHPLKQETK